MILLMLYVAMVSAPPAGRRPKNTVLPDKVDFLVITTLIGGTVGGYITYSGAHRMIDTGVTGVGTSSRSADGSSWGSWSPASCACCCSWRSSASSPAASP